MKLIATINGVPVYSDMDIVSINGDLITFEDGSWVDGASMEIHSAGKGTIRLGEKDFDTDNSITMRGPHNYQANSLDVRDLMANVVIGVHEHPYYEVSINGPKNLVDAILIDNSNGELTILQDHASSGAGIRFYGGNIRISGNATVGNINTGSISIGSNVTVESASSKITIEVKVPRHNPVSVSGVMGKIKIGETEGKLNLKLNDRSTANVNTVSDLDLNLSTGAEAFIVKVTGSLYINLSRGSKAAINEANSNTVNVSASSSGELSIYDGVMPQIEVDASFGSSVRIYGEVTDAKLSASSSAYISVDKVLGKLMRDQRSGGEIRVPNQQHVS